MSITAAGVHERNSGDAAPRLLCSSSDTRSVPAKSEWCEIALNAQ
jgi:hypothetical protein